ncbi:hypothetical protein ACB092_03G110800 [Castanea dentata]
MVGFTLFSKSPFIWSVGSEESSSSSTIRAPASSPWERDIDDVFSLGGKHDAQASSSHLAHKQTDARLPAAGEPAPLQLSTRPHALNRTRGRAAFLKGEVRIRSVRILIGLGLTWFTRYWFPEELISPLAKPLLTLPFDSYFVCTQSTEAFPTYVATSSIACSYFVFPLVSHQIWCFLIPSCYGEQRTKYNRFLYLSGSRFSLFLFLTPSWVVPNVWHFLYFVGATSTNSLMIKLQPKIYDYIMLTVRISFIPSVCSQVPVIVIRLPELRCLSVETFTNNRRFLMVFPLFTAALSTPLDIWCQIVACFLISLIIELAIFVASIVQVREEGWTSGMRESGSINKKED